MIACEYVKFRDLPQMPGYTESHAKATDGTTIKYDGMEFRITTRKGKHFRIPRENVSGYMPVGGEDAPSVIDLLSSATTGDRSEPVEPAPKIGDWPELAAAKGDFGSGLGAAIVSEGLSTAEPSAIAEPPKPPRRRRKA